MKTNVYIDGFNLYYGALKGTRYRWLNLRRLAQLLLPNDTIQKVRYFTALVSPHTNGDPDVAVRQQLFLRATRTLPDVEVHYGTFLTSFRRRPVAPVANPPHFVQVAETSEKGSDVNLASYLLTDCFDNHCEQALVISGDSDLAEPIRLARQKLNKRVVVAFPDPRGSALLRQRADSTIKVFEKTLREAQLPDSLRDANGTFTKPKSWIGGPRIPRSRNPRSK
ncbi:MAG: NYN domain-containing protein [Dehalococcoidia bacterium]